MTQKILAAVEEELTAASARRLVELLDVEQATELCLDFVAVRRVGPGALGIVAEALQRRGLQVSLVGLSRQDVRLLAYLGVNILRAAEREEDPD